MNTRRQPPRRAVSREALRGPGAGAGAVAFWMLLVPYAGALAWALSTRAMPLALAGALAAVNLLTFAAYWVDKRAAIHGRRRIAERALHLWSLAGGWPAAWWAQRALRHKSAKVSFRRWYWVTVVLHGVGMAGWVMASRA